VAANQLRAPSLMLGYWPLLTTSPAVQALNAAATWLAYNFVAEQAKTLSEVSAYLSAIANPGSLATTDLTCDLYSDSSGSPNASLQSRPAPSVPGSAQWLRWTGFSTALTAGTPYWLVLKNANAAPATNFPTYQWVAQGASFGQAVPLGVGNLLVATPPQYGWGRGVTTNSGGAWTLQGGTLGMRLGFSDSTYDGTPVQNLTRANAVGSGDRASGKQACGVRFNVPSGATLNVRGAWFVVARNGAPGSLVYKLYSGTTLLGTTYGIGQANVTSTTGDLLAAYFPSALALSAAGNPYRLVMADSNTADASTLWYGAPLVAWDSDASSLALKPLDGTLQETVTTDYTAGPPVFTDTSTNVIPFGLLLDTLGEFTAGGGGGLFNHPGMAGRMNG